jgi:acyl-CoA synthetase (AMP-forming)/AMP-acid ligase II
MTTDTFADIIRRHAAARPDAPALTFAGRTRSFADLDTASSRVADGLRARGIGPGDRVAVLSKNRAEFFEAIIGCSKLGATLVGLNWRLSAREIAEILDDCEPALVLVDETGAGILARIENTVPVLPFGPTFDTLKAQASDRDPGHDGAPDDVALILYTSGTTGRPKGAMLTNRGMSYTRRLAEAWGMSAASVNLVAMPLFHIGGCGYGSSTMMAGGHTILMAEMNIPEVLKLIELHRVTHTFLVPALVQILIATPGVEEADISSLDLLMYGASPMGDVLLRRAMAILKCRFIHAYGMTESSGTIVNLSPDDHVLEGPRSRLLKSCGRALPWVELKIVDPAAELEAPRGTVGELWVRTPMLMKGYWRNETATREAILEDGWFRTGDAAFMDDEDYVFLVDRYKDMIISGGENIYPTEIENVLCGHPAVAEVGVIGVPHAKWGETPLAVVVLKPGRSATEADLTAFTRENLATYKCPSQFVVVDALPRNATGKLLKPEMRRLWGART